MKKNNNELWYGESDCFRTVLTFDDAVQTYCIKFKITVNHNLPK